MISEKKNIIIRCFHQKYTQEKIASIVGVTQSYVSRVIRAYQIDGTNTLNDQRKTNGASSKLTPEQMKQLAEKLKRGAQAHSYPDDRWTKHRLKAFIKETFNVDYHADYMSRLMNRLHFSSQRPQTKDYRQDTLKVTTFKTEVAPELKKKQKKKAVV